MTADIARTRRCVDHYRTLGLCPLPSRTDVKGPMLPTYAEHYGPTPVPESVYYDWRTTNVQLITGAKSPTPTKLLVVDCDGAEAAVRWQAIREHHGHTPGPSWVVATGSGGLHHYFLLPDDVPSCPSGMIWGVWDTWGENGKGRWLKHQEVRILGDNALVIAPPSIHVETSRRYEFTGDQNPNKCRLPEVAPDWLLAMPRLAAPRCHADPPEIPEPRKPAPRSGRYYTREKVLEAVADRKLAEAKSWGLVTKSDRPNSNGWVTCWVPGREDPRHSRPSGSFHIRDGTLQDRKDLSTVSLFDLGVILNRYATWQDCRDELGDRYLGKRRGETTYQYVF